MRPASLRLDCCHFAIVSLLLQTVVIVGTGTTGTNKNITNAIIHPPSTNKIATAMKRPRPAAALNKATAMKRPPPPPTQKQRSSDKMPDVSIWTRKTTNPIKL